MSNLGSVLGEGINPVASLRCVCPGGTKGPRCKRLTRTFIGEGWLWLDPLPPCSPTSLSLHLLTTSPDVHLLYSGPLGIQPSIHLALAKTVSHVSSEDPVTSPLTFPRPSSGPDAPLNQSPPPQLLLRLVSGHPRLDIKGPGGSVTLQSNATLHDGVWHTLHLHLDDQVSSTPMIIHEG
ncbi:Neural-cadherin [Portunus trituberculatus]|uniref:Neural-cadherin n=1 Tax=Portunus trituberculatus TaxID=210409 RepID=A0A5B7JJD6_PORTR|nr:Neural-cadherin [Portunus trituberculatus]